MNNNNMHYSLTWDHSSNQILRCNNNGIMLRSKTPQGTYVYGVYDLRSKAFKHIGKLDTAARGWQRYYSTPTQFSTPNKVNHRYLFAD